MLLKNGIYVPGEKGGSWWIHGSRRGFYEAQHMEHLVEQRAQEYRHHHSPKRLHPNSKKYAIKGKSIPRRNLKSYHFNWL